MRAFLFPGQGSQKLGMGKDLAENFRVARDLFEEVDEALSQKLSELMFSGAEADLALTSNTQPALMAVSLAVVKVLEQEMGSPLAAHGSYAAGHSLGEYSALAAMGSLSVRDAARLLRIRGDAMQSAVPVGVGAMAALLGVGLEAVEGYITDAIGSSRDCEVANDNSAEQVVISGEKAAVEKVVALAQERGVKRAVFLPVSAPFHCSLMRPAADKMAEALEVADIKVSALPIITNTLALPISNPQEIRDSLVSQVTGRVRWRESMIYMLEQGVRQVMELGSGKVLSGLAKRADRDLDVLNVESTADIDAAVKALTVKK